MHNAAFDAAGIDGRYELLEIDEDAVAEAVEAAHGPDWLGLGVTAPYKRLVAGMLDEVEDDAREIGAVNNVVRTESGRLVGFNSDAPGFRAGVELALGRTLAGLRVVVAGAGGAAHAVVHALEQAGVARADDRQSVDACRRRTAGRGSARRTRVCERPPFRGPGRQRHDRRHDRSGLDHRRRGATRSRDRVRPRLRAIRDAAARARPGHAACARQTARKC